MNPVWVEKARRALLTGQPRLAELYMRRGLGETPEGARWLAAHDAWMANLAAWEALRAGVRAALQAAHRIAEAFTFTAPQQPAVDRMMAQFRAEIAAGQVVREPHPRYSYYQGGPLA